ncbi:MAG: YSC84-related protein [Syntrophobacteraceae bacterium]
MLRKLHFRQLAFFTILAAGLIFQNSAKSAGYNQLDKNAFLALRSLCRTTPAARTLRKHAVAILIFPRVVKAGFIVGAQTGNGVLLEHGRVVGHYNISAASYGLQAGLQAFGYAMFFMSPNAIAYLNKSEGFEVGTGPGIVLVDRGIAKNLTTTTLRKDVYAFIFGQKGLMAGVSLQGSKITRVGP